MKILRQTVCSMLLLLMAVCTLGITSYAEEIQDNNEAFAAEATGGEEVGSDVAEEAVSVEASAYYDASSYLTSDQNTALLTLSTNDNANIASVVFNVWNGNGQNMRGYSAALQSDGRWISFVGVSDFGLTGRYDALATVIYRDGHTQDVGYTSFNVDNISFNVNANNIQNEAGTFDIVVTGINSPSGVDYVDVVAFTKSDFSDCYIYRAYWNGSAFVANVNVAYHQYTYGTYGVFATVHAKNGVSETQGVSTNITKPAGKYSAYTSDGSNFFLIAEDTPYGAACVGVKYNVWHDGISDLRSYGGMRDGDRWLGIMPLKDYMKGGDYYFQVQGIMYDGTIIDFGLGHFYVESGSIQGLGVYNANSNLGTYDVMVGGANAVLGVSKVRAIVFTKSDLSDAHEYEMINCGNGTYLCGVDVANHQFNYGTYGIAIYITDNFGIVTNVYTQYFNLDMPSISCFDWLSDSQSDVLVGASNLPYYNHTVGIVFYVWNNLDGSDMRNYVTLDKHDNYNYYYTFSMTDFNKMGTYYVKPVLVRDDNATIDLSLTTFNITNVNGMYGIMGSSGTNVNQMVRYMEKYVSYPQYYADGNGGAPTIRDFCQIVYDEAAAEGVRAEVVLCQAMKETGYLRFGGAVDPAAYNFAGIGAVDSSPGSFNWFPDIRTGIRAQVQHLKAYASTNPLNNACVDPRYNLVNKGCAPYVEDLGGKWASGANYGYSIRNDYMAKLFAC